MGISGSSPTSSSASNNTSNSDFNSDSNITNVTNKNPTSTLSLWNYNLDTKILSDDISKQNFAMIDTIIEHLLQSQDKKTLLEYLSNKYHELKQEQKENYLNMSSKEKIINDYISFQINLIFGAFVARLACSKN